MTKQQMTTTSSDLFSFQNAFSFQNPSCIVDSTLELLSSKILGEKWAEMSLLWYF